MSSGNIEFFLG